MKEIADPRFGKVMEPSSFEEVLGFAAGPPTEPSPAYMWRGQADESWLLHSAAYRRIRLTQIPTETAVREYENYLLKRATHKGFRYLDGRELSDFELLARLQHHGAATRLLDTTRNILVGLFFACHGHPEKAGLLFGVHSYDLGGGEGVLVTGQYSEHIRRIEKHDHPQTWEPPTVSGRVAAQHSQFIYSAIKNDLPHGSIRLGDTEKYLIVFRISPAMKTYILQVLSAVFDVRLGTLFPDLDGFGAVHSSTRERWSAERW